MTKKNILIKFIFSFSLIAAINLGCEDYSDVDISGPRMEGDKMTEEKLYKYMADIDTNIKKNIYFQKLLKYCSSTGPHSAVSFKSCCHIFPSLLEKDPSLYDRHVNQLLNQCVDFCSQPENYAVCCYRLNNTDGFDLHAKVKEEILYRTELNENICKQMVHREFPLREYIDCAALSIDDGCYDKCCLELKDKFTKLSLFEIEEEKVFLSSKVSNKCEVFAP